MQEVVSKFQTQIAHIARLADDLVDVARLESERLSIERKPLDLRTVLIRARDQSVAASPQVPVRLRMPDQPAQVIVQGDEARLVQVIGNLLSNAVRHATGTSSVEVTLTIPEGNERKARIEVSDSGPGIAPEVMKSLFTRFSRGTHIAQPSRSGLGLGLFISRGIVEQHGGTFGVRSKVGEGTCFTVELPLAG
jgi:signal transduction histidine kinase